jgi:hypothetical protein
VTQPSNLQSDLLVSKFAFEWVNLYRYNEVSTKVSKDEPKMGAGGGGGGGGGDGAGGGKGASGMGLYHSIVQKKPGYNAQSGSPSMGGGQTPPGGI